MELYSLAGNETMIGPELAAATLPDVQAWLAEHGMVAVPVEPTDAMKQAALDVMDFAPQFGTEYEEDIYKAMIKAAEGGSDG